MINVSMKTYLRYRDLFWRFVCNVRISYLILVVIFCVVLLFLHFSVPEQSEGFVTSTQVRPRNLLKIPGPATFCPEFDPVQDGQRQIFFIESTGEECLTGRQACTVESAARMNPNMTILIHMGIPFTENKQAGGNSKRANTRGNARNCQVMKTLLSLPNVYVTYGNLVRHLQGTYLWKRWYAAGSLNISQTPHVHLSDAVRVALLQKHGGIYLDLDVIALRPLHCLRNTAGYLTQLNTWVENGVMTFDAGHPFLEFLMKVMVQHYSPNLRESMGPPALGLALKFFCGISLDSNFTHQTRYECHKNTTLQLQAPEAFYGVSFDQADLFYNETFSEGHLEKLKNSYLSHVYFHTKRQVPLTSLYGSLARTYCPQIYDQVLQHDF